MRSTIRNPNQKRGTIVGPRWIHIRANVVGRFPPDESKLREPDDAYR